MASASNTHLTATYKKTYDFGHGFTVNYKAIGNNYNNHAKGNVYLGVVVGNITAGLEVLDAAKTAVVLKIRVDNNVVATSEPIFDSTKAGWDASKENKANIGSFFGGYNKELVLDYDAITKTVTFTTSGVTLTYVDEAAAIDVSNSSIILKTHSTYGTTGTYKMLRVEGKVGNPDPNAPVEPEEPFEPVEFSTLVEFNSTTPADPADWTLSHASASTIPTANGGIFVNDGAGGSAQDASATYNQTFDLSKGFTLTYKAVGKYTNNYEAGKLYLGVVVGNIKAGYEVPTKSTNNTANLVIKVSGATVATKAAAEGIDPNTYFGDYSGKTLTLSYNASTKVITLTDGNTVVTYNTTPSLENATVQIISNATWDNYATYNSFKLEGVAAAHTCTPADAVKENVVEADCVNGGSYDNVVKCADCGKEISRETVKTDALGHNHTADVTAPDCVNGGYTTYTCGVCGDTYVSNQTEALGHSYTTDVTAPTCTTEGYTTYTCGVCGDTYVADKVPALGHDYDADVTAPDCENGGYTTYTCGTCGDTYVADQVSALGHTVVKDEAVAPTLNSTGLTEGAHCDTCGKVLVAQDVIPMVVGEASIVGGLNYATLEEAVAAAVDGDVIALNLDVTTEAILVIDKAITINGYGHTLTYKGTGSDARAINVKVAGDVTIYDLIIDAVDAERAINVITYPANLVVEKVTAVSDNYTVNVAGSGAGATVAIVNSTLTGKNVVNVGGANVKITIDGSTINCVDDSTNEGYSALALNKDATNSTITATNTVINVNDDSVKATNGAAGGQIIIDDSADEVDEDVAYIQYGNYYYGFTNLADAVAKATDGETIVLLRDVTLTEFVKIAKKVTIDLNGFTITADFVSAYGAIYVAPAGDLTIKGAGTITSADIAIGNYGKLAIDGATVNGDYASIYNFYFDANTYGKATINGTVEGWILNCGEMTIDGSVAWVDNSGALVVNGEIEYLYARDGSDAAGVEGAGTIAIADPSAIEVPEGYVLLEVEAGIYVAHAHDYDADVTDPTCTAEGYTTYTCACGDSYVDNYTDALGHAWGEWEITTEATAAVPGVKTRTCGTCGATETEEYVLDNAGVTGEVTWRFEDGTIYIEGNGAMDDYLNLGHTVPWADYRTQTTAVVIGDGVTHVGNRAFRGFNRIITVTFGNDVETMGYEAFYLCNKITTVTLNEGLTNIGSYAFYGCTALEQIEIPSTVATLDNRCFKGAGLTSIVVPNTVTYTGYEVFMNCASLETVEYSTGVQFVNSRVFENCTSLKSFYVASNIQRLRTGAFYGCTALESVTFEDANNMWPTPDGSCAKIASDSFAGCNATLKFVAEDDSHVEQYASRFGFVFEAK